jgi:cytochrome-b5 reductase
LIGGGSGITPLYQLIHHALNEPTNRTRFTLLYANVTEADILLRDELAALQRAHPATFKIVHSLDKPPVSGWSGASGYVSRELIQAHVPPAEKGDKIKVFICGMSALTPTPPRLLYSRNRPVRLFFSADFFPPCVCARCVMGGIGPPGQVNAVAGKKDGMKQGAIGGILKELGYTEGQVFKF